jgi:hypothetical protein
LKPIKIASLREIIHKKLTDPIADSPLPTESVASILEHNLDATIQYWMELVEDDQELTWIPLSFDERSGHLSNLLADLIYRLRLPPTSKANISGMWTPANENGSRSKVAHLLPKARTREVTTIMM